MFLQDLSSCAGMICSPSISCLACMHIIHTLRKYYYQFCQEEHIQHGKARFGGRQPEGIILYFSSRRAHISNQVQQEGGEQWPPSRYIRCHRKQGQVTSLLTCCSPLFRAAISACVLARSAWSCIYSKGLYSAELYIAYIITRAEILRYTTILI